MEAHALSGRGWSISAIARHLDLDRKTVRPYLNGERQPGVRRRSAPDALALVEEYLRLRFVEDPHVWASALYDEVVPLGYRLSYPSFVRQVRAKGLRPHCEACHGVKGRDTMTSREEALAWAEKIAIACRCAQEVRALGADPELDEMIRQLRGGKSPG